MEIALRTGPQALEQLAEDWRALWERDPTASLFQRPEYLGVWLPEFGTDRDPVVVEARRGSELAGLAVLSIDPDGVLRFLGDRDVTDYFGPVAAPADRETFASGMAEAVARLTWDRAELTGLAADVGWVEPLARAMKAAGLAVAESQPDVCPRIALTGTFDDYLATLDAKLRHEIKRKARKLERDAGPFTIRLITGDRLHHELEHFFEMHRSSDGPKGHFLHWGMAGFFTLVARAFDAKGWLRFNLLEIDHKPLAGVLSFSARKVWSVYNSAFDHSRKELGAGMVVMAETIRLACEEGCTTFDLLRGDEPYKYRFGAVDVPLMQLEITRT